MSALTLDNQSYVEFLRYGGMLLVKLALMSPTTSLYRFIFQAFASKEDGEFLSPRDAEKQKYLTRKDPNVERTRAAHLNDLENVVPFFIVAPLYLTTNPNPATAGLLFKVFVAARFGHTVAYLGKLPQPSRAITFGIGLAINLYLGIATLNAGWSV